MILEAIHFHFDLIWKVQFIEMNKKAGGELLKYTTIYLILVVIAFAGIFYYIQDQKDNASVWSEVYAKQIALLIDTAHDGDEITLDIQRISGIAQKHEVDFEDIVNFDRANEVCVRLSSGRKSCYSYFNDVVIRDVRTELGVLGNVLHFKVVREGE